MPSEQYRVGRSSVTPNQAIVSGYSTAWNTEVLAGDVYKPDIDTQPTAIIGTVNSATSLTLSGNWGGTTVVYQKYMIQRSWTPNSSFARPFQGDADLADILREQVIDKIDSEFQNPTWVGKASATTFATVPSGITLAYSGSTFNSSVKGKSISSVTYVTTPSGTTINNDSVTGETIKGDKFTTDPSGVTVSNSGVTITTGTLRLPSGTSANEFSTDGTLTGNSDNAIPTEKAVKTYADTKAKIKTGTYTGDGTLGQAITGVGFRPKYLRVWERLVSEANIEIYEKMDDNWADHALQINVTFIRSLVSRVNSLDADGFTVDDDAGDAHPNGNGTVYSYLCLG